MIIRKHADAEIRMYYLLIGTKSCETFSSLIFTFFCNLKRYFNCYAGYDLSMQIELEAFKKHFKGSHQRLNNIIMLFIE